jgi:predicted  nucleic acid-binding Zn-ribbon protein
MSDPSALEERLAAALARIETATTNLPDPQAIAADAKSQAALEAQFDEERGANAQLVDRVKALKDRQENQVAQLEKSLAAAKTTEAEKNIVQQKLKASIEDLRDQIARLTEANRAMVGDADLINTSMMAELEAMRASRRADVSDVDDILAQLEPHLEGGVHA